MLILMVLPLLPADEPEPQKEVPVRVGLKLGAQVSPRFSFAGGLDIEFKRLSIAPGWSTRLDADILSEPTNDGFLNEINLTGGLTLNQIYARRQSNGRKLYGGLGIGYYAIPTISSTGSLFGNGYTASGRVGGKLLFGMEFTSTTSAEMAVHLIGGSRPLFALQARLKL